METVVGFDTREVRDNRARRADPDLTIINAHDRYLYEKACASA